MAPTNCRRSGNLPQPWPAQPAGSLLGMAGGHAPEIQKPAVYPSALCQWSAGPPGIRLDFEPRTSSVFPKSIYMALFCQEVCLILAKSMSKEHYRLEYARSHQPA